MNPAQPPTDPYNFNPHHPRGWRRKAWTRPPEGEEFQSTPPSRVATLCSTAPIRVSEISIHTTLAGGDLAARRRSQCCSTFQSTPPSRVATSGTPTVTMILNISIHTTLAGGDNYVDTTATDKADFNPHHPRGWRQQKWTRNSSIFYSY